MKNTLSCLTFVLLILGATSAAQAQSSPSPSPVMTPAMKPANSTPVSPAPGVPAPPAPSPSPSAAPSPPPKLIQFSGFADAAYTSRAGDTTTQFASGAPSRVFDFNDRQPTLQNLNVQAALTAGNLFGKLELSGGSDANIIQSWPGAFNGFDVTQAYIGYNLGKLSAQAGKFETLAGAEVIEAPSNLNFSRSILFGFAVPFTHTGGRLTYAVTPHLNVIGGVNAGWDEIRSTNGRLTAEYGFAFTPSSAASLTAQGYTGFEQLSNYTAGFNPLASNATIDITPSGAQGQRSLIDVVGTIHPNTPTTITLNYDRGLQQNASMSDADGAATAGWSGLAGYAAYQINPRLVGAVRYEGFHDTDGYRSGYVQFWREGTATLAYNLTSAFTLRGEYRHDVSDQNVFLRTDGATFSNTNSTFALEGFVKF